MRIHAYVLTENTEKGKGPPMTILQKGGMPLPLAGEGVPATTNEREAAGRQPRYSCRSGLRRASWERGLKGLGAPRRHDYGGNGGWRDY
jgi:hypothetical protein